MEAKKKTGRASDGREMHYSAGVMVTHGDKYLLLDRMHPPLGFACPAGHVDLGEEPKETVVRETFEETGVQLKDLEFILEEEVLWNSCRGSGAHYWYLYRGVALSEKVKMNKEEMKSLGWYTLDALRNLNLEPVWKYWFEKTGIL